MPGPQGGGRVIMEFGQVGCNKELSLVSPGPFPLSKFDGCVPHTPLTNLRIVGVKPREAEQDATPVL